MSNGTFQYVNPGKAEAANPRDEYDQGKPVPASEAINGMTDVRDEAFFQYFDPMINGWVANTLGVLCEGSGVTVPMWRIEGWSPSDTEEESEDDDADDVGVDETIDITPATAVGISSEEYEAKSMAAAAGDDASTTKSEGQLLLEAIKRKNSKRKQPATCHIDIMRVGYSHREYFARMEHLATPEVANGPRAAARSGESARDLLQSLLRERKGGGAFNQYISLYAAHDSRRKREGNPICAEVWLDPMDLGHLQLSNRAGSGGLRLPIDMSAADIVLKVAAYCDIILKDALAMRTDHGILHHILTPELPVPAPEM